MPHRSPDAKKRPPCVTLDENLQHGLIEMNERK